MIVTGSIEKVRKIIKEVKRKNKLVGFIPTMGALHPGHLSLVKKARKECGFVAVSIFVNPAQFGAGEDFKKYPRDFKSDKDHLKRESVNLIFHPAAKKMYPEGFSVRVKELVLSRYLCGKSRPGHFEGVCTIIVKLFNILRPDVSYFGRKDYQQAQVIKKLAADLNFPVKVRILPIIRERNGLALSSRNVYLKPEERQEAMCLYRALKLAKRLILKGEKKSERIIKKMRTLINKEASFAKIDYISIVDSDTLEDVRVIKGKVLIALAVYLGKIRLIDNILVG